MHLPFWSANKYDATKPSVKQYEHPQQCKNLQDTRQHVYQYTEILLYSSKKRQEQGQAKICLHDDVYLRKQANCHDHQANKLSDPVPPRRPILCVFGASIFNSPMITKAATAMAIAQKQNQQ
jgi:hypothetical protein